jgi:guanylate kinase
VTDNDAASPDSAGARPLLVIISGPSGVGKDALLDELRERDIDAHFTVTATTRPKREVRPEDHRYLRFLSEDEFQRLLAGGGLLEHATVYGYHYGVPKAQVIEALARGRDVIVRVDVQGAATIKRIAPAAVAIFLASPSMEELESRLRARGLDDGAVIRKRLAAAEAEMSRQSDFDHVVVNEHGRLAAAADDVLAIMARERGRPDRTPITIPAGPAPP